MIEELFIKELYDNKDEEILCPLCRIRVRRAFYSYSLNEKKSHIYRCDSCGFLFLHPAMLDTKVDRRMDSIDDAELFNNSLLKTLHRVLIVNKEIRLVKRILRRDSFAMLDIGCGTGWTTSIWKDAGINVTGLEPSKERAALARERYRLPVIQSYIEELDPGLLYDVIVMRHVIEHLDDPVAVLGNVRAHLYSNGIVLIIVPNIDCIGRYIFGSKWTWVLPFHCNFFSPRSMEQLIERSNLETATIYQTPSPLWYPQSFLRLLPGSQNLSSRLYSALNMFSFLPFAPIVLLGYLMGISDNITVIARMQEHSGSPRPVSFPSVRGDIPDSTGG